MILSGWDLLVKNVAPNARYDSDVSAPACDEGTRAEAIEEITTWIKDRGDPRPVLCLTGAAGAGKSALQQTIARICAKGKILGCSFSFSANDPTRNTVKALVPTMAYQLAGTNEKLKKQIETLIGDDPLVFHQSLETQMTRLIAKPFEHLKDTGINLPYVILIDGLDECRDESHQMRLLEAIHRCLLVNNLPFRILVASRLELAIRNALEPGGHLHGVSKHIPLSDKYCASQDMTLYLQRRFQELAVEGPQWFNDSDVKSLVEASSGQFVYVTTAFKYISEPRGSPVERLQIVLTWTARQGARPFETLDTLYTKILIFQLAMIGDVLPDLPFALPLDNLNLMLNLGTEAEELLLSDLRSLVGFEKDAATGASHSRRLYHKSFADYLYEESRSKDLFAPRARVYEHLAKCFLQHIVECPLEPDSQSSPVELEKRPLSRIQRTSLQEAVLNLPFFWEKVTVIDEEIVEFTRKGGWHKIDKLLPSTCYMVSSVFWESWTNSFCRAVDNLKGRNSEAAEDIGKQFDFAKWKSNFSTLRKLR
ncbi:hypothetical protein EST38_g5578 [Candolleomyces aberdarensis]|uniref:Nephrocystin 3-like N-terminal domain-containing protein n=1 Tax=Candolleomyces aberdarensis TaxID=2316362 RepID=A0A4Q2DJQ1_9AGAR|nr:hypothetical protein EST38_g5578 [Candolleomyces aberdarensis]